ncbi:acetylglutamate kinase [Paenibacillus oenotherae]|uniref:Acetylglutamate kinase n=1 Tax=Paenibacillus oenotherae TaxID=1435645 RepID=A0ABS7D8T0_9BACL|nr:acetylglutamate kinase [Paenibacillus oenotherae]MBW7476342.1 acetylglutamate kinase [Paenibacillus oenotherae]
MYGYSPTYYYCVHRNIPSMAWPLSKVMLNQKLRALWEQHIYWTRLTVNAIVGGQPDEKETTERLLRNATDFAEALTPFYGPAIAARFGELLREHLTIAAELVKALLAGNTAAAEDAQKRWFANADAIAEFLSRINPYWSQTEWKNMLYDHLRLLSIEVTSRIAGNYKENIAINDQIEPQALMMADVMTNGIVQQFPAAFTR